MRNPMRAAVRLALTGWLGLAGLSTAAAPGRAASPAEKVHPSSTVLFFKVNNAAAFRDALRQSQAGQLWADPAFKAFKDDVSSKFEEASKSLKDKVGLTLKELLELPTGAATLAVLPKETGDSPIAIVLTADAGTNAKAMTAVMTKATEQGGNAGAQTSKEEFKGQTINVIQPPKPKDKPDAAKGDDKKDLPPPPIVWTQTGSVFFIGSDVDAVKDVVAHADGRDDALASSDNYTNAFKKLGSDSQAVWYADLGKLLDLIAKVGAKGKNAANIEQFKAMSQVLGISGIKAAAGSLALNSGNYDSVTKTFVLAPAPVQGVLRMFSMPKVSLKPEPWVPATVASYQTWSWDLDAAYTAINDLANMFQPGVLNVLEQQLVGPNGGEPLSFKKDIFDPLGNRITLVSDFKKPVTEDSQRMLLAVALQDANAFQGTLGKLINLAGGAPKKRDFQGTTIYDFELPDLPNANGGAANVQFKGPISVAVAKNSLFASSDPTFLEMVLRGGSQGLADSNAFQTVAKQTPDKVSSLTYVRPEEQARVSYEMVKSGQFEKALQGAAIAGGPDASKVGKLFDKDKLPDFSVFAKYLSTGGGYSVMEDDGVTFTSFSLRKANP